MRYQRRDDGNGPLRERLTELARQHRRHGYRMLHNRQRIDGWAINIKRTYRLYCEQGLMVRQRKKLPVPERQRLVRPMQPNAVLAACDTLDGVRDSMVSRPSACTFNPATLRCTAGDNDGCLTDAQIALVNTMTSDFVLNSGQWQAAGFPLTGGEADVAAWPVGMFDGSVGMLAAPAQFLLQEQAVKYMFAKNAGANSLAYDPNVSPGALATTAAQTDIETGDFNAFRTRGGKLILWHGADDAAISVKGSTRLYQQAVTAAGGQANANAFMRYYVAPGVTHCGGGVGADLVDLVDALDKWVVNGTAPGNLVSVKLNPQTNAVSLSRPLCTYPNYPRYVGSGDINLWTNYTCTVP